MISNKIHLVTALIGFSALFMATEKTQAHHQGLSICNKSADTMYLFFVHKTGLGVFSGTWSSRGRYILDPGECTRGPMGDSAGDAFVSVNFLTDDGKLKTSAYGSGRLNYYTSGVKRYFCANPNQKFTHNGSIEDMERCPSGYQKFLYSMQFNLWENKEIKTLNLK